MIYKYNCGDKVKVIDASTKEVLVNDFVVNFKRQNPLGYNELISFDNKYFFQISKKDFIYEKNNDSSEVIPFDISKFENKYEIELWSNYPKHNNFSIYRERDITELDPEVKNLVYSLNKIKGIRTVGSCSGHSKYPLWVDIDFMDIVGLEVITKILYAYFNETFKLTTNTRVSTSATSNEKVTIMTLETISIGEDAFKLADKFAKKIEMFLETFLYIRKE